MRQPYTVQEIEHLIHRFAEAKLPAKEWTHEAHLVVAIWYSSGKKGDSLIQEVREKIIRHNESVGTPNTDSSGYHHTLTVFWLWVAQQYLQQTQELPLDELCAGFIHSPMADRQYPLVYYTRECLFSVEARRSWVSPDRAPLDKLIIL